jgi:histidine triad (HIT) family protein
MCPEQTKTDCVFCKIAAGDIPTKILFKDKDVVVFPDIEPAAPVHLLVIPVKHISSLAAVTDSHTALLGKLVRVASRVAKEQGLAEKGFRLTINSGPDAGQVVSHLHIHILGGRQLTTLG